MAKSKRRNPQEIRDRITNMMVDALTKGLPPWRKTWANSANAGNPRNFQSRRRYTGINPLVLLWTAMAEGWDSCNWGTAHAWNSNLHVHVRKGEKATYVVLYHMIEDKEKDGTPKLDKNGRPKRFPLLREYPVFNADQMQVPTVETLLDGRCGKGKRGGSYVRSLLAPNSTAARAKKTSADELGKLIEMLVPKRKQPETLPRSNEARAQLIHVELQAKLDKYRVIVPEDCNDDPDFEPAEALIKATRAKITHRGSKACYRPNSDDILLPPKGRFQSIEDYYETAFHELVHWTQPKKRVGEVKGHKYAFGELVAEIGACFLMMELGVPMPDEMLEHSQSYVKHWLEGMTTTEKTEQGAPLGPKFIFDAATQAGKAVDYLLAFVGKQNPAYEEAA
jgi:antirestriction protein ArdC